MIKILPNHIIIVLLQLVTSDQELYYYVNDIYNCELKALFGLLYILIFSVCHLP